MRFISLSRSAYRSAPKRGWLAVGLFPAILACGTDDEDHAGLPGEIGTDHFFYECATIDDPQCREELTTFPEKIAVGARFDLEASTAHGSSLFVEAASPMMVAPSTGEFEFLRPGVTAFLATRDGRVHDFAHLLGVEVASLGVQDSFGEMVESLNLTSGQRTSLTVVPFDHEGDILAGSLTYRWATNNEAAILVERTGTTVSIHGQEPGGAQVRVSLGDQFSLTLNVVVHEGAPSPVGDGGGGFLDAGGDAAQPDAQAPSDGGVSWGDAATTAPDGAVSSTSSDGGETMITNNTSSIDAADAAANLDAGVQP
jgi:hypothetical protein